MSLNKAELVEQMITAFKTVLKDKWPDVKSYAESEAEKMAQNFVMIEKLKLTGEITEEQARLHYEIQRNATRAVLLTVEGLGLLAVEEAINSAMNILKDSINTALGFTLI